MAEIPSRRIIASDGGGGDKYDAIFGALADQRRRLSFQYLLNTDTSTTVTELATELEAGESQSPTTGPVSDRKTTIKTSLVHVHLPKMHEAGLIEYDDPKRTIMTGTHSEAARKQLEAMRQ